MNSSKTPDGITQLVQKATTSIAVERHLHVSGNAGLHLDSRTTQRLINLKLALDIDTYISGIPFKYSIR